MPPQREANVLRALIPALRLLGIGWYFALSIVGGIGLGLLLDGWLETEPLFAILGLLLGLTVAFWGGYKLLMQVIQPEQPEKGADEGHQR